MMANTINGRTPEEIKKGLENGRFNCEFVECCETDCPYEAHCRPGSYLMVEIPSVLVRDALEYIQQLESAQPKWISVEERLPEDDLPENSDVKVLKVFVAIKGKNGTTMRTQTRHRRRLFDTRGEPFFDWEWRYSSGKVTHWMPLPCPPKEMK